MQTEAKWYALTVKPQHEFKAFQGLTQLGNVEGFLPTYKDKRVWSDRVKILDTPLFPGYVFAKMTYPLDRVPVLRVGGVRAIVGGSAGPGVVSEDEVESIRTLVNSEFPVRPWPFLRSGQRVKVTHGPLRGVEGIFVRQKDEWKMVVSIEILQRSVAVLVDRSELKAVSAPKWSTDSRANTGSPLDYSSMLGHSRSVRS